MNQRRPRSQSLSATVCLGTIVIALVLTLAGGGCSTSGAAGPNGYASVTIRNQTSEEILRTTVEVFRADGYQGGMPGPGQLVFTKAASVLTSISRDGFVAAGSGERPVKRAWVEVVALHDGSHRLRCKAVMITGGSDPFFQEEKWLPTGHYQSLLNKVAKRLK